MIHRSLSFILVPLLWLASPAHAAALALQDSVLIIRSVEVRGNDLTKEHVILREMESRPGDTLRVASLYADRNRIYNLQLFNIVDVTYDGEGSDARVTVEVQERWYIFPYPVLGFRFGDIKKMYYGAGVIHQNFRGRNEKVLLSFALGYDQWVSATYQTPKLFAADDFFLRSQLMYQNLHSLSVTTAEFTQMNIGATLAVGKRYGLYQTLVGLVGYNVWYVSIYQPGRTLSLTGRDAFFSAGGEYWYDSRNLREYATEGMSLVASIVKRGFGESDVNLLTYTADVRWFEPFWGEVALAARGYGVVTVGGAIPSYRHVYYGHAERIRGHFDTVREAENITGANLEFRIPLVDPRNYTMRFIPFPQFNVWRYGLYLALFADVGKIWYRTDQFLRVPSFAGYGLGLHVLLPYSGVGRLEAALNERGHAEVILTLDSSF